MSDFLYFVCYILHTISIEERKRKRAAKKSCNIDDDYENDGDDNGDEKKLFPRI